MRRLPLLLILLAGLLLASLAVPAGASHDDDVTGACPGSVPEDGFRDVGGGNVHEGSIDCLIWWELSGGATWAAYEPATRVPRAQMATFVARFMEVAGATLPAAPGDHFDDDDQSPHELRINQLAELGVISGTGERTFSPARLVTRGQSAALLVGGYEAATGRTLPRDEDHFDDDGNSVHEPEINAAASVGWAKGVSDRRFEPTTALRRDAMASFLVRGLDTLVEEGDASPPDSFATGAAPALTVELVTDAVEDPIHVTAPAGDDRLFIAERAGRILVLDGGNLSTFLDIRDQVSTGGERGLLGFAFPPGWPDDGRVFASWTDLAGDSHLESFAATPDGADADARTRIDLVAQPASNHNGGMVAFGPDGLLWWALGDGGGGGDQYGNGQDGSTALGGLNRYDVTGTRDARPAGNTFAEPSLWAIGLRNPWRFAFDPVTDHLYVADVGQGSWEEVNVVPARRSGVNYGWPEMEGDHCYRDGCDPSRYHQPEYEYATHEDGTCSVTGGVVYRGSAIPGLRGHYLLSDYCAGFLRTLRYDGSGVVDVQDHAVDLSQVVSFGTDDAGEAYVVTFGGVYRIVPAN